MGTFTVYSKSTSALSRKEWIKQRRAAKGNGSMVIVNQIGGGIAAAASGGASVVVDSGAGEEALALLNELFERVNIGTEEAPVYAIRAKYGFYSDGFISAGGLNPAENNTGEATE